MSNNCLKAKSFILLLLMKSNRQKQQFCHPKMADLKAWSHGVRKANWEKIILLYLYNDIFINMLRCDIALRDVRPKQSR